MSVIPFQPSPQASLSSTGSGRPDPSVKIKSTPHPRLFRPNAPQMHKNTSLQKSHTTGGALLHLLHFPPKGKEGICGLAAPPASIPAQPAPKPSLEPGLKSAFLLPPSIPNGHLKPPPSQAEPPLVLHPAHTPVPDTCAGRELIDLAGTRETASLWLSPSLLWRKHLLLLDCAGKKVEGCSETAREAVDFTSRGDCLGEKKTCHNSREVLQTGVVCPQRLRDLC